MTVAAGFRCNGGIVFGADTDETVGDMRRRVHKIPQLVEPFCTAITTGGCENGHLMDTAIERIFDGIRETNPPDNKAVGGLLRQVMIRLYGEDFRAYPSKATRVHLLVAVKLTAEKSVEAWSIRSSVVRRMHDKEVIGTGELIQWILDHLYTSGMGLDDGVLTMIQLLAVAKRRVNFVGGDSYVSVLMKNKLVSENVAFSPSQEELYDYFISHGRQLFLATGNKKLTEGQYEEIARNFMSNMEWFRDRLIQTSSASFREGLMEHREDS
jgi:hypothetical protein